MSNTGMSVGTKSTSLYKLCSPYTIYETLVGISNINQYINIIVRTSNISAYKQYQSAQERLTTNEISVGTEIIGSNIQKKHVSTGI